MHKVFDQKAEHMTTTQSKRLIYYFLRYKLSSNLGNLVSCKTFTTIITARKRSLRRLCFYTCLSVILFTGGVCPIACWDTPPRTRGRCPPTPDQRYPPRPEAGTPREQTHSPPKQTPPRPEVGTPRNRHPLRPEAGAPPSRHHLSAVHAGRYGQRAGVTHPTGMQFCCFDCSLVLLRMRFL